MDIDFVIAETAIRQLQARYTDAVWRKDLDAFADCFTEDAEWRIEGTVLRGRTGIVENMRRLLPNFHAILMTFRTPILEVGNGTASGRTYSTQNGILRDGRPGTVIGIYYERFVDQGDRWRYSWRLYQTHYMGPADVKGPLFENPDFGPPPNMPPLDTVSSNHTGVTSNIFKPDNATP